MTWSEDANRASLENLHASIERGLQQSATGETVDRGDFTQYVDDRECLWSLMGSEPTDLELQVFRAHIAALTATAWDEAHDAFCPCGPACSTHLRPGDRHLLRDRGKSGVSE